MAPSITVTTVTQIVNTKCSIISTIDAHTGAFINAIVNTDTTLYIITGHVDSICVSIAVTVVYECRAGGRNGSEGTCVVSKVLICVFFLGHTGLKCGCFPTRDRD